MTELPKLQPELIAKKPLWRALLIFFVLIFLFWIYKSARNVAITEKNIINEINNNLLKTLNNNKQCYQSYVNNTNNNQLKNIQSLEESILNNSKSNNIFFHQTNCIHDGVIRLNAR